MEDHPEIQVSNSAQTQDHLAETRKEFDRYRSLYGDLAEPTQEGIVWLLSEGKDVWNAWQKAYPNFPVDFRGIRFKKPVSFSGFEFTAFRKENICAFFGDVEFDSIADFTNTIFFGAVDFKGAKFHAVADFYGAEFHGVADFSAAKFDHANFSRSLFYETAFFKDSALDYACFSGAKFSEACIFDASKNEKALGTIFFDGTTFKKSVTFANREFHSTTYFGRNRVFAGNTRFEDIPIFHSCKIHQDTSFDGAEFLAPPSPEAARAYRTLKLAMEQLKATREEQRFFRLEMKAEHPSLPFGKRLMSTCYNLFSDYGFSLWRPLVWLLALSLAFGESYRMLADVCAANIECARVAIEANVDSSDERTSAIRKFALASASPVPGLDKMQTELRAPLFGHHGWVPITALSLEVLHKIVSLVMTFLFALALRNLFKMKS